MPRHSPAARIRLGRLAATAPDLLRILVSASVIVLALTVWRLRGHFKEAVNDFNLATGLWPWLPVHLVAFVALELFSRSVFTAQASEYEYLAWFACVIGTALSWLAAAIAPRCWPALSAPAEVCYWRV